MTMADIMTPTIQRDIRYFHHALDELGEPVDRGTYSRAAQERTLPRPTRHKMHV
jgi:hypothetical protein